MANKEEIKNPAAEEISVDEILETEETVTEEEVKEPSELEKLQDDYAALNDKYLRLMAEYDNFRKRSQREKDNIYPEAVAATVAKFLPVLDNFERAHAFETTDPEYKKGVDLIYTAFSETLQKLNAESFAEVGDPFDPELHNAVMHIEDETLGENVVAEEFQKGYMHHDSVIRCSMVKVAN